ncbi:MAG: MobF family relaxase [Bryobacteraceae bacterium]
MLTIRAMSDGKGYAARHLENNDYYAEGERVAGAWWGRGAELLGLSGVVAHDDFEAVRQGLDPQSREYLRARRSADRRSLEGTALGQGRSLYDFTISAPKSVSVMALLGGDSRLVDAHGVAVAETLQEIEACAASRVRKGGANADRVTSNLVAAVYHHDTSRELDPQLHTHAVAANLTFDGAESTWKALQAGGVYERRAYLTEVYRNALAREVEALGYEVEGRRDRRGRDAGFEIRGVPEELLVEFSQRSRQRDDAIRDFVAEKGRQPTDNEVAVLVRESRARKLADISTAEVRARQRARMSAEDERLLASVRAARVQAPRAVESAEAPLVFAKDHVFERVSVARDHEVVTEALRRGRGRISLGGLKAQVAREEATGGLLRNGSEIATRQTLERERAMIAAINRGAGTFSALGGGRGFVSSGLRAEQAAAVEFVLRSRDRAVGLSGAAGTGKTAALRELRRGLGAAGREVLAVAPTMSAVEELKKVGFAGAVTLERLLRDSALQDRMAGAAVILDEAGMVSARQMADFLRVAEERSLRIVFSGDTKQIQSVEAGDALRILEKESRLRSVRLTQVQRQSRRAYRGAVEELRRSPAEGFARLEEMGAVREVPLAERARAVADAYAASGDRTSLVVCATHDEIERVTAAIREDLRARGQIGDGVVVRRYVSLGLTAAERADVGNFRAGQVLGFHRAVQGIGRYETAEVVGVESGAAVVRTGAGVVRRITRKQAGSFDVFEAREIEVAAGDRLLLTANRREAGLRVTNGELVTVAGVGSDGGISLTDGRRLPADYRHFAHGYAVTAHRSQGKSVDAVIVSADGMQRELFYVAASRGREQITVVTSDREGLRRAVGRSMERKSASELVGGARPVRRGIEAARRLVRRAVEFVAAIRAVLEPRKERQRAFGIGR